MILLTANTFAGKAEDTSGFYNIIFLGNIEMSGGCKIIYILERSSAMAKLLASLFVRQIISPRVLPSLNARTEATCSTLHEAISKTLLNQSNMGQSGMTIIGFIELVACSFRRYSKKIMSPAACYLRGIAS